MRFPMISLALLLSYVAVVHGDDKPIRALLVTGGCCHDYAHQKTILTEGISARANVVWSIVHEGDGTTDHKVSIYDDPDWANNYDVVVHDECFADVKDAEFVRGILKPHRNGLPAVNLHCAMHCYRVDFDHFKEWFEFTGIDSRAHGAQLPIAISFVDTNQPVTSGLTNWSTGPEELYNNLEIWKTVTPLAYGEQGKDRYLIAWMNDYRGTRVFSTTLGHNNATVSDPRYLDLVTRGLLWAVNKLDAEHLKPAAVKKAQRTVRVPVNLALNKKATAFASQDGHPPEHAVDSDTESRWCAPDNGNNYWWQVDLEKPQEITGVRVEWEKESANYEYVIAGSADGQNWKTLISENSGPRPQIDEHRFKADDVRYVRITVLKAPPGSWASFFEFAVLGKELVEKKLSDTDPRLVGVQCPAGFEQTLFAGPPDISYPTCLEATPTGDVFVGVDQNGSLDREKNRGWVARCRDANGDGVADTFTTFAKMDSPRGLVFSDNTLFVMHPPVLEAYHDDNGDGIADRSEVLVRGLGNDLNFRGADHTCNGVRMGIDGFLYIALGDYGALNAVAKDNSHVQLHGGGIVRLRPDGSHLEVVTEGSRNIYDVAIDPFMNLFTCDNTNDGDDWNVRLSHMIPGAHYGYPSLFKNFSDEIMPAMADYGGGSPTGAFFLDEPGFPDDFGRGLYVCQWGWINVTRHPLTRKGATFTATKQTFLRIPRPTGIAADGQGNLYVASWKGATFNYVGPNAGFVVRISALSNETTPFPDLHKASGNELVRLLQSPSAVRRLHVQREILKRPTASVVKPLRELVLSTAPIRLRVAAVFTLGQMNGGEIDTALTEAARDSSLKPYVIAVAGSSFQKALPLWTAALDGLKDEDPVVRLQSTIAMLRKPIRGPIHRLVPMLTDRDPAVAHIAYRTMLAYHAGGFALKNLDRDDERSINAGMRVLAHSHQINVVDALIKELSSASGRKRQRLIELLCRLYYREADWDGSWWTTRPDTSGPYYKPVRWDATDKIEAVLREAITITDPELMRFFVMEFQKYKIDSPALPPPMLENVLVDSSLDATLRHRVFQSITRLGDDAAIHALLACNPAEKWASDLRRDFVSDLQRVKNIDTFAALTRTGSEEQRQLAYEVLLHIANQTNVIDSAKALAEETIQQARHSSELQRAKATMTDLRIPAQAPAPSSATVAKLNYADVVKRAANASGDVAVGAKLFETVGCIKCHTIKKSDPAKGPYLGDITVRYSKEEILESILHPSAKIAQGFETATLETKDGESLDGFIVRESGDEIELRNITGPITVPKKNITQRGTRKTSIMPDGLADNLSPEDLGSLLRYLDSMRTKQ